MSKAVTSSRRRKASSRQASENRVPDRTFYAAFLMVGAFIVAISVPLFGGGHWREVAVGYVGAMAVLVNLYAFRAYMGGKLERWQKALARLPLRCAGYGSKGGKPLEAAHGQPQARKMIVISLIVSAVILLALAFVLLPQLRGQIMP